MTALRTDQYVSIERDCPISTEVDRIGESAQVNIGALLGRGDALRLLVSDVDTCDRLARAFVEVRNKLVSSVYESVPECAEEKAPAERVDARRLAGVGESRSGSC
jgi:hypothetical protein